MIARIRAALVFVWLLVTAFGGFSLAFCQHLPEFPFIAGAWGVSALAALVAGDKKLVKWLDA